MFCLSEPFANFKKKKTLRKILLFECYRQIATVHLQYIDMENEFFVLLFVEDI